jgi:DNA-binding MarR family transcriptional regulator
MSTQKQLTDALRSWAEVFMHRSMRDFGHFMHTSGLSMPQVNTLMRLYYKDTCGVSDIGRQLGVSNAAASQMIDRMVQQGLLERTECAGDRRVRQLSLTGKGRTLVEQAIEARHQWLHDLPAQLTREQQTAIVTMLSSLTEAAKQLEETAPSGETRPRKRAAADEAPKHP